MASQNPPLRYGFDSIGGDALGGVAVPTGAAQPRHHHCAQRHITVAPPPPAAGTVVVAAGPHRGRAAGGMAVTVGGYRFGPETPPATIGWRPPVHGRAGSGGRRAELCVRRPASGDAG